MSKRRNKDNDIVISSIGTSTKQVTGSCWSISYKKDDGTRGLLMVECGLPQGQYTIEKSYNVMEEMTNKIKGGGQIEACENLLFLHPH